MNFYKTLFHNTLNIRSSKPLQAEHASLPANLQADYGSEYPDTPVERQCGARLAMPQTTIKAFGISVFDQKHTNNLPQPFLTSWKAFPLFDVAYLVVNAEKEGANNYYRI